MPAERKEPRKKLMAFTPVYELRHKILLGFVGDLTLQGAMVVGEKALEAERHFILGIEFPETPHMMGVTRIVVSARVAWCRQDDSLQEYNIGFEFIEMSEENRSVIETILERYQFRSAWNETTRGTP